ncbi:hypothetical protein B0T16DRAFT_426688 [Cercophora newfieldiana]|uniref:DUF676 domain-containing protein n=1 Tax=Cercophora newfieldiana TaxID=92897 RepID=A0AA39YJE5_9PEZI|nr:hypothetical protein B0T16DRAFT_426688 [Cercophora newfieldiana]
MSRTPSPHSGSSSLQPPVAGASNGTDFASWKRQQDPRSSSTQSLLPSVKDGRRTLLVVYIHGFMGNDSSFRSFPAHVHNFLRDALAETHVIHSKIYPRYKTYKAIDVARDNFSKWLEPHESPTTDVVLVGHSMGGLLAADIVLMPNRTGSVSGSPFRHRILGTVSLDAPLLGLHPGIVVSGIASLFRPAPAPERTAQSSTLSETISPDPSIYSEISPPSGAVSPALPLSPPPTGSQGSTSDPMFNPPFFNDVSFTDRGWLKNIAHFAKKHREENIVEAAAHHIMSHLEFGGCLADYPGLRTRYNNLRRLEDVDESKPSAGGQMVPRVRFVNYYTASTGLPKKPKAAPAIAAPESSDNTLLKPTNSQQQSLEGNTSGVNSGTSTPRISIEDHSDSTRPMILQELDPVPESDDPITTTQTNITIPSTEETPPSSSGPGASPTDHTSQPDSSLSPIPDPPTLPEPPNLEAYTDKESRKQAEKEAKRARKIYEQALKDRERAIKERQKILDKRQRKALKDAEKRAKAEQKEAHAKQKSELKLRAKEEQELHEEIDRLRLEEEGPQAQAEAGAEKEKEKEKKKKERKFCMLPGKTGGVRDPAWVRVYMEGVDEVGAHCGLFAPGPHYETLVGDMGSLIVDWVHEDATRRAIAELS